MAALVQTIPSTQSTTITMLQTRPSSSSGILQTTSQSPQFSSAQASLQSLAGNLGQSVYRGSTSSSPVAPYAFTSTPGLTTSNKSTSHPPRPEHRATASAPVIPTLQHMDESVAVSTRSTAGTAASTENMRQTSSKDDAAALSIGTKPPLVHSATAPVLGQPSPTSSKPSPDRYRRTANRRGENSPINTHTAAATTLAPHKILPTPTLVPASHGVPTRVGHPQVSADDLNIGRQSATLEQAKRYRRRSIQTIDAIEYNQGLPLDAAQLGMAGHKLHPLRSSPVHVRPGSAHGRHGSSDSAASSRSTASRPTSAHKRDTIAAVENPTSGNVVAESSMLRLEQPKIVQIPPRNSSADAAAKRVANPSPLSQSNMRPESPQVSKDSFATAVNAALQQNKPTYAQVAHGGSAAPAAPSPAAQQLAAVTEKDGKKRSSKLRRAFSFGSAAELRTVAHHQPPADENEAEHERIAQKQEEGGIGRGIYSGQGGFFSGSTDNLSISSTASSASVMIRKMGRGMKKSTRSLVGLFRPKSIVGAPAADPAPPELSYAQVSMVTVEAPRDRAQQHTDAPGRAISSTSPRLELSSIDTDRLGSFSTDSSTARRSIVGGERERAEVLATIRKGILKRSTDSANSSPTVYPADSRPNFGLPQIPHVNDSPNSTAPSTPTDDAQSGHRRTGSVTLSNDDYFVSALKFSGEKVGTPGSHQSAKRSATFSPRIQFHDTWPSAEYDRRAEIATCNRLTPMLAQQIKEELNTFKMEMEVHENSKIYTHFF